MTLLNCTREYNTRGIPYRPKGEPMEMPGSPRHFAMQQVLSKEKLQRETAEAVLRQQGRPQGGPQYTPHAAEGRPLTMGAPVVPDFESVMNGLGSSGGEGYKQDVRANPAYENVPEHVLAARERMSSMEVDSFGPASRRMVRPPPPILDDAPRAYFAPRVELPAWWWGLMAFFMATFYVLSRYGN